MRGALIGGMDKPDWVIKTVFDRGPGHYYRYQVTGENLSQPVNDIDRMFCWSITAKAITNPRYDLSNAMYVHEVQYAK